MTKALFNEEIKPAILEQLGKANQSIHVVVAWFNDADFFNLLLEKVTNSEIELRIILSEEYEGNNTNTQLNFQQLLDSSENVYIFKIPKEAVLVHNKFCIIDRKTLVHGSYNWTYGANFQNKESVLLVEDDEKVCFQFLNEFDNIFKEFCNPIILSSTLKLQELFFAIQKNIEHGNIRLAMNVDEVINGIRAKFLNQNNEEAELSETFEDFNLPILVETHEDIIAKWWTLLPQVWKSFFLIEILKVPANYKPDITSLKNLLSATVSLTISDFKVTQGNLYGIKNLLTINSLNCKAQISSLKGIEALARLKRLIVSNNKLNTLIEINGLASLEYVDASSNNISSLSYLGRNSTITHLEFYNNPCTTLAGIENLTALQSFKCDPRFEQFPLEIAKLTALGLSKKSRVWTVINGIRSTVLQFEKITS
jgi:hypothetical protein